MRWYRAGSKSDRSEPVGKRSLITAAGSREVMRSLAWSWRFSGHGRKCRDLQTQLCEEITYGTAPMAGRELWEFII